MRYHAKNSPIHGWVYEEAPLANVKSINNLLARILIAKIEDEARLVDIFRNTPIVQNNPDWRCRTWVADALSKIIADGRAVGTSQLDWGEIEKLARDYVARKTAQGRYAGGGRYDAAEPTWNLIDGEELIA